MEETSEVADDPGSAPQITAIVGTFNRGLSVGLTVETLLANDHPDFAVLVVDQSTEEETREALEPYFDNPRFTYLRTDRPGKGRAINIGINSVSSPYIAFTDDDCEIPTDWLRTLTDILDEHPRVGMLFTNVVAAEHDSEAGFVPDYVRSDEAHITTIPGKIRARGIGASMAGRRQALTEMGGFDEHMGPGSRFPSADDRDLAIRALLAGWEVYESTRTEVIHHGFRTWDQGKVLTERDWVAMGAMCAKPLRAGHWSTIIYPIYEVGVHTILEPLSKLASGRRPQGFKRGYHFVRGFIDGWRTPMDGDLLVYVDG